MNPTANPLTTEEIINFPAVMNAQHRNNMFSRGGGLRKAYEPVWNKNPHLRSRNERRAGMISDFYVATLPETADEMFTKWASIPERNQHLKYTTTFLTQQIHAQELPVLSFLTPEQMALAVSAHYLIDRSFLGFGHERNLYNFLLNNFGNDLDARFATGAEDKKYGIDLFVNEHGFGAQEKYGVQVKPQSFFNTTTRNTGLKEDRDRLFSQIHHTEKVHGIPVKWHIVPDEKFDFDTDGKIYHTTEEALALIA